MPLSKVSSSVMLKRTMIGLKEEFIVDFRCIIKCIFYPKLASSFHNSLLRLW